MNKEKLYKLYKNYELTPEDVYKHKHYLIVTRSGVEKIQSKANIKINYEVVKVEKDFCVVKAIGTHEEFKNGKLKTLTIETFGSALFGYKSLNSKGKWQDNGTTQSWYVMEIAEKRAMSRIVLKLTGFYELNVFGEDEADDFKNK